MPKDHEARTSQARVRGRPALLPGAWPAAGIAALSALALGVWARPDGGAPSTAAGIDVSAVAEVAPQDLEAALDTVSASGEQLAQFRRDACGHRLAWVTIMRGPGQVPGRIRLQSGPYISPAFDLGEAPARVAMPFPAPYATGHGSIAVLGTTTGAIVSLVPAWHVPTREALHVREVTWRPKDGCPNGSR